MTSLSRRRLFGLFAGAAVAPMLAKVAPALAAVEPIAPAAGARAANSTAIMMMDLFQKSGSVVTKVGAFIHGTGHVEYSLDGLAIEPGDRFGLYWSGDAYQPRIARVVAPGEVAIYSLDELGGTAA